MSEFGRSTKIIRDAAIVDDHVWENYALNELELPLIRYVQMFVRNEETAKDIVQDSFLKLCQQKQAMEKPHVKPWLYKVCRNGAVDFCRKEQRMNSSSVEVSQLVSSRESEPSQKLEQHETYSSVMSQIEQLPVNQKEVLRLKFQSGFSYQEIAEVTGLSKSNVGVLLHTALTKLRSKLQVT